MANCKDCIHYKVCCQKTLRVCKDFKDRSRFVELPCERGDLVYFIKARHVMADEDLIELRGYYKGLEVAREMLYRTIAEQKEMEGE